MDQVTYRCADCQLDTGNRRFTRHGQELVLEPKVFAVLVQLNIKLAYIGAAVAAALGLIGITAHASCTDPRTVSAQASLFKATPDAVLQSIVSDSSSNSSSGFEPIVGTWLVTYSAGGTPYAEAYIQWHGDGTEWENINFPVLQGNICMGSWKRIGEHHFSRNHHGWLYDNGTLAGYFHETENDVVSPDGRHYHGQNTTTLYFLDGTSMTQAATSSAVLLRD